MTDTYAAVASKRSPRRSRRSSREVAYDAIKHAILAGQIPPHERLVEERLAEALEISRTPVREALAILEHEGWLESEPYKGLAVRPITVDEFLSMYAALGIIEASLARTAAMIATAADIRRMDEALQRAEATIPDNFPEHLAGCREFQSLLSCTSEPTFLTRMLLGIEERSDMYLINSGLTIPPANMYAAVEDRRAILERIKAGDADGAAQAAFAHADRIQARWPELYPGSR